MQAKMFETKGKVLKYWKGGVGPSLVLLHGAWSGSQEHWASVWEHLKPHFTVWALDIPGWGESSPRDTFSASEIVAQIAEWAEAMGIHHAVWVGNSFGGGVAQLLASEHPHLVRTCILVNTQLVQPLPKWVRGVFRLPLCRAMVKRLFLLHSFSKWSFQRGFYSLKNISLEERQAVVKMGPQHAEKALHAVVTMDKAVSLGNTPVAFVWGENDRLLSATSILLQVEKRSPLWSFYPVPYAGHLPQRENALSFVDAVRDAAGLPPTHKIPLGTAPSVTRALVL